MHSSVSKYKKRILSQYKRKYVLPTVIARNLNTAGKSVDELPITNDLQVVSEDRFEGSIS